FNGDVTPDVMRSFMEKETLAVKYQSLIASEYSFTDEELKSYVEENRDSFYYVDYLKFTVDEDDVSMPKATAEGIAGAKSADEFLSLVSAYLTDTLKDENAEETLGKCAVTGEKKKSYGKFSEWAFGGAKENDTFIDENAVDGQYTVYMLTKAPYIDETPTKNARIIRENVSSHNSYQDTINYLNGLLDKWKEEGGTEDAFAALAEKESDDTKTKDYGGLLNCVSRFDTTVAENIRSWLFEDGRTAGDTGVVKGDACYYAVYFSGEDAPGWEISAQIGMGQKKMQEDYEALEKQYPVTSDEAVIASLDA
ncbi:MAG: hypothetical protein PUC29_00005, partial [Clostridia bacterium]|nr:hypothetical protein [Clostridia bacterium]